MIAAGLDEKIYPVAKLAKIVDLLAEEGVSQADALAGIALSASELSSPATRVSSNQVIEGCRNAERLSRDAHFSYHAGLRFHVSSYGMFGFAILSSMNFRQTVNFAIKYQQLAAPLVELTFMEEGDRATWTFVPIPHSQVDARLYRFLVEMQLGIHMSLHRDIMGPSFMPQGIELTYEAPVSRQAYRDAVGCDVAFGKPVNKLVFDAAYLDRVPELGNEGTYSMVLELCNESLQDLQLRVGVVGKVREIILVNLMRPTSFDAVAKHMNMTARTLRRKLEDENTSFRKLMDELRMQVAIKYLRDTNLPIADVAYAMGFSDEANFRHAFRRWTNATPYEFRAKTAPRP